eukprot:TRINITY_DN15971_c0_g1_i1.p1 TRINITY_DN15971_c0_g1~~TRINITY_DN15971_c0_g1_i1.p1  ORF type:complete len:357 (-),score=40.52 TRINITY_DN15971_c0_g1_i1:399-1448(-)
MLLSLKAKLPSDVRRLIGAFIPPGTFQSWDSTSLIAIYDCVESESWIFDGKTMKSNEGSLLFVNYLGSMQELVLNQNSIGIHGTKVLAMALGDNTTLRSLHIEGNDVGGAGAVEFANALRTNRTLQTLFFKGTHIGADGAAEIATALEHNDTLRDLSVCNPVAIYPDIDELCTEDYEAYQIYDRNEVSKAGALAFAAALRTNKALLTLNLSDTGIDTTGVKAIAEALHHNNTLRELVLGNHSGTHHGNHVGDEGAVALVGALRSNSTLQRLDLTDTKIGPEGRQAIGDLLRHNHTSCCIINPTVTRYAYHDDDDIIGCYDDVDDDALDFNNVFGHDDNWGMESDYDDPW